MNIFQWVNSKIKYFTWIDLKLIALGGIALGIILVKLWPVILTVSFWWLVALIILIIGRICYLLFQKR